MSTSLNAAETASSDSLSNDGPAGAFTTVPSTEISLLEHDIVVVFGDLNYRMEDVHPETVRSLVQNNNYKELYLNYEHLKKNMAQDKVLNGFQESELNFPPTYKFVSNTNEYVKDRVPSWTDRILFKINKGIVSNVDHVSYRSIPELRQSDHKPVYAEYVFY